MQTSPDSREGALDITRAQYPSLPHIWTVRLSNPLCATAYVNKKKTDNGPVFDTLWHRISPRSYTREQGKNEIGSNRSAPPVSAFLERMLPWANVQWGRAVPILFPSPLQMINFRYSKIMTHFAHSFSNHLSICLAKPGSKRPSGIKREKELTRLTTYPSSSNAAPMCPGGSPYANAH